MLAEIMKTHIAAGLTMMVAAFIVIVLGSDMLLETEALEQSQHYDGGKLRALCILLAAGIMFIQLFWVWTHRKKRSYSKSCAPLSKAKPE